MSNTQSEEGKKRKQQYLAKLRRCKPLEREFRTAVEIFDCLNTQADYRIAWPSEQTLSRRLGKDVRTIKQHVAILKTAGVLRVEKMGGAEFRAWAKAEFGIAVKAAATAHLMNVYLPLWESHLATTGELSPEQAAAVAQLRFRRRSGNQAEPLNGGTSGKLNRGTSGKLNRGTSGKLNRGTCAPPSGRPEPGSESPVPGDAVESNLSLASEAADQTASPHQDSGGGRQPANPTPNPAKPHPTTNPGEALPVSDPAGFLAFLAAWSSLAAAVATVRPMTPAWRRAWADEWEAQDGLKEGAWRLVLDEAAACPFLMGLKVADSGKAFELQPGYLLTRSERGLPRWYHLALREDPFYDFKAPVGDRVRLLVAAHGADAAAHLDEADCYAHERPRFGEILTEELAARRWEEEATATASLLGDDRQVGYALRRLASADPQDPAVVAELVEGLAFGTDAARGRVLRLLRDRVFIMPQPGELAAFLPRLGELLPLLDCDDARALLAKFEGYRLVLAA